MHQNAENSGASGSQRFCGMWLRNSLGSWTERAVPVTSNNSYEKLNKYGNCETKKKL